MSRLFGEDAVQLAGLTGAALGWPPDRFWQATPAELSAVLRALAPSGEQPLGGADLVRMMEQFPDG